jgi:putative ABC transport system permease protein
LLFVATGLYGIVSFAVSRRTPEFGVRMAVGASSAAILGLVLRGAGVTAGLGAVIGVAFAVASGRVLAALPMQVQPPSALHVASAAGVVVLVVLAASYMPARRASRVSLLSVLRAD